MLSADDIERRVPVWTALSDLFRDNVTQDYEFEYMAKVLRNSGLSRDELKSILFNEVFPAFRVNLMSMAGNWAGWDEDFVRERVLEVMQERGPKIGTAVLGSFIGEDWKRIEAYLDALETAAPASPKS